MTITNVIISNANLNILRNTPYDTLPKIEMSHQGHQAPCIVFEENGVVYVAKTLEDYIENKDKTVDDFFNEKQFNTLKKVVQGYSAQYDESLESYSSNEQATFPSQESEARAYSLDNTSPTPTIDNLATARGIDRVVLINKVLANLTARDTATGQQQAMEDQIKACTTIAELEALGI